MWRVSGVAFDSIWVSFGQIWAGFGDLGCVRQSVAEFWLNVRASHLSRSSPLCELWVGPADVRIFDGSALGVSPHGVTVNPTLLSHEIDPETSDQSLVQVRTDRRTCAQHARGLWLGRT